MALKTRSMLTYSTIIFKRLRTEEKIQASERKRETVEVKVIVRQLKNGNCKKGSEERKISFLVGWFGDASRGENGNKENSWTVTPTLVVFLVTEVWEGVVGALRMKEGNQAE